MELTSARALKEEISELVLGETGSWADAMRKAGHRAPSRMLAAVGVCRLGKHSFGLALRVFEGSEKYLPALLGGRERYLSEIDVATGISYKPRATLRAGISLGHRRISAGTLGGFVEDEDNYYILSNNHVLANCDDCARHDEIVSPAPSDIRIRNQVVAYLERWVPLHDPQAPRVDAAIARFSERVSHFYPWHYPGIGSIVPEPADDRFTTKKVVKRGRSRNITRGEVSAYELDGVALNYGTKQSPRVVIFDNQLEFISQPNPSRPFSRPGDSGSWILDRETMRPYALLYAGSTDSNGIDRTLGHFMPEVLTSLGVRLVR